MQAVRRIVFVDALKAIAIISVVAVHAVAQVRIEGQGRETLIFVFGAIAVPLFFLVDGFLFSGKWTTLDDFNFHDYVRKSVSRLLVPWAAITVLYAFCRLILESLSLPRENVLLGNTLPGVVKIIYLSGLSQQMYFLLSLFVVRLTTIGTVRLLRGSKWLWLAVFASYAVVYGSVDLKRWFFVGADPLLLAFWGIQFYLLGIVLQKWQETLAPVTPWLGPGCLILSFGIWSQASNAFPSLSQLIYLVGTYATVCAIADRTSWGFSLGKDTMGIYLLHAPYVLWLAAASVMLVLPAESVVTVLCVAAVAVLASWGLTNIARKTQIGRVMFGGS
jgi:surface polysaccharide O-acyltransferase-like enzyme